MSAEREVAAALLARAEALATGIDEAFSLTGPPPETVEAFAAMDMLQRIASTALLKRVEQLEDVLMRLFRTLLRMDGVDTAEMSNRDIANRMEKWGLVDDAESWMAVVRLRNRLAHEYPVGQPEQFDRLVEAHHATTLLKTTLIAAISRLKAIP